MAKRRKRRRPCSSSPSERIKTKPKKNDSILCFQDVWNEHCCFNTNLADDDEEIDAEIVSNLFYELANVQSVSYRLEAPPSDHSPLHRSSSNDETNDTDETNDGTSKTKTSDVDATTATKTPATNTIVIQQDVSGAAQTHTGGIVWETSYLLLNYLLSSNEWLGIPPNTNSADTSITVLEIGAGCGLLGLSLHKAFELGIVGKHNDNEGTAIPSSSRVILTETSEVMDNLRGNLERNYPPLSCEDESATALDTKSHDEHKLSVEELDWTRYRKDCAVAGIEAHSVDCIVGTDVVFSTRFVLPMLETMQFLSHSGTLIYLCLQERCRDSHRLLLKEASFYGFAIEDISETVYNDETLRRSCGFGRALECKLLKFTVVGEEDNERKTKKKSKKDKKGKQMSKKEKKHSE